MLRAALVAGLVAGIFSASASAQGVDCLASGRISLLSVQRQQVSQGGAVSINVLLQNTQSTTQNFSVYYTGPARYAANNAPAQLSARQQRTQWVATMDVGGNTLPDDVTRSYLRLSCS